MLDPEISINNFKILRFHSNRHEGDVACYVRNDRTYNILIFFHVKLNFFLLSFTTYFKATNISKYLFPPPQSQSKFLNLTKII